MDGDEFEKQLLRWKQMESDAVLAEQQLKGKGQLGASPEAVSMLEAAARKRRAADEYLAEVLGAVKESGVDSERRG